MVMKKQKAVWVADDETEFATKAECVAYECMGELSAEVDDYLATLEITERTRTMRATMIQGWLEYDTERNPNRYVSVPEDEKGPRVAAIDE